MRDHPEPPETHQSVATSILTELVEGDATASERLWPLVYDQLRGLAGSYLRNERKEHTLQPTALVHEAYVQLIGQRQRGWEGESHFLAVAAIIMRRILLEHARKRSANKRGADWQRVSLHSNVDTGPELNNTELIDLDNALCELAELDERQARIVECRYFGGMTVPEVATALDVSKATVERDWTTARAWLHWRLDSKS